MATAYNMDFLTWSCEDVARWIESIGYPQYIACFTDNFVTGRKLIYVNCQYLPRLGITYFKDMQGISARVRQLLRVTEPLWSRSVAEYPRDSMAMFLERKSRTGERSDAVTYEQFLDDMTTSVTK